MRTTITPVNPTNMQDIHPNCAAHWPSEYGLSLTAQAGPSTQLSRSPAVSLLRPLHTSLDSLYRFIGISQAEEQAYKTALCTDAYQCANANTELLACAEAGGCS